ncbi:hypothetical protein [Scale drop disease virus]|uniref:Uncharacterized protein n=1 Tax=Scale drop disease virus TaxID=1697349 RepID=A0A7D5YMT7_9VIRU|nr:hypothetical protein [Scale drop disease virus]QXJ13652.1 hypothetical protein PMJGCIOK_00085 [Scale drop disease virus]UNH60722.1 hypothetical protein SDDV_ORF053 [Scale drop disease virus]
MTSKSLPFGLSSAVKSCNVGSNNDPRLRSEMCYIPKDRNILNYYSKHYARYSGCSSALQKVVMESQSTRPKHITPAYLNSPAEKRLVDM